MSRPGDRCANGRYRHGQSRRRKWIRSAEYNRSGRSRECCAWRLMALPHPALEWAVTWRPDPRFTVTSRSPAQRG